MGSFRAAHSHLTVGGNLSYSLLCGIYCAAYKIRTRNCCPRRLLLFLTVAFDRQADALFEFMAILDLSRQLDPVSYKFLICGLIVEHGVFQPLVCDVLLDAAPRFSDLSFSGGEFVEAGIEVRLQSGAFIVIAVKRFHRVPWELTLQTRGPPSNHPTVPLLHHTGQIVSMEYDALAGVIEVADKYPDPMFNFELPFRFGMVAHILLPTLHISIV